MFSTRRTQKRPPTASANNMPNDGVAEPAEAVAEAVEAVEGVEGAPEAAVAEEPASGEVVAGAVAAAACRGALAASARRTQLSIT